MGKWIKEIGISILLIMSVTLLAALTAQRVKEKTGTSQPTETAKDQVQTEPESAPSIRVLLDGEEREMELSEYLTGVLLCEMPAKFHPEAKKAQAVVARTYASRVSQAGVKHGVGVVCGDPGCCQGYISPDSYLASGGTQEAVDGAREAIAGTEGLVLTYNGSLIDATYFSCSGGMTEDALAVWGTEVPYLQAVESPGEEYADHYTDTVRFSPQEFCDALGISLTGLPPNWFGSVTYTNGGGVETMRIGNRDWSGTELRSLLGLRSTCFTVTALTDSILITTKGFGHRVGMSQFGADAMANAGSTYEEILSHYYQGSTLETIGNTG